MNLFNRYSVSIAGIIGIVLICGFTNDYDIDCNLNSKDFHLNPKDPGAKDETETSG